MIRIIASLFIAACGLALLFATIFVFFWDNKGAISIWDKSVTDWILVSYLFLASSVVLYAAFQCITARDRIIVFWLGVVVLLTHSFVILVMAQGDANMYLGVPHLFLGVGLLLWYGEMAHPNKSSEADAEILSGASR